MNGRVFGVSNAGGDGWRVSRSPVLARPINAATETLHGVRPLLAAIAATAGAMLTAILWA